MGEGNEAAAEAAKGDATTALTKRLLNLRSAALVAEIIGGLAVVVSLIFVGVQLAQANKLERNAAMQRQVDAVTMLSRQVIDTPGLSDSFGRANRGETLTRDEKVRLDAFLTYADRTWEGLYLQYLDGQIDKDLWAAHRSQALPVNNSPVSRVVWNARKDWYTPKYRAFREAELATATGEVMSYDYFKALEKPQPIAPAPAK
jgi:hypothetical protein